MSRPAKYLGLVRCGSPCRYSTKDVERSSVLVDRLHALWEDPLAFGAALGHRGVLDFKGNRRKTYSNLHQRMVAHMRSGLRTSTVVSRNHGKSTVSQDVMIWEKWHRMDHRCMYTSAATALACQMLGEMRGLLKGEIELLPPEDPSRPETALVLPVRIATPELVPTRKGDGPCDYFSLAGRTGTGREPCFFASSVSSSGAGLHPTLVHVDDPANEKNSTTPTQREKPIQYLTQLEPILRDPSCAIRHIGTPWAFWDVTAWIASLPQWSQLRFGCWEGVNPDTGIADGAGPGPEGAWPLAPSYMSAEELLHEEAKLTKAGKYEFWCEQYLCSPIAASNALFSDELLHRAAAPVPGVEALPEGIRILLWDPTSKSNPVVGDWNGLIVVHATTVERVQHRLAENPALYAGLSIPGLADMASEDTIFYPIEATEIRGQLGECMDWAVDTTLKYDIKQWWIENSGAAGALMDWAGRNHHIKKGRVQILPINNTSKNGSKDSRLQGLQIALQEGRIRIPQDFPGRDILLRRLSEYPKSESDDLPDAFAFLTNPMLRQGVVKRLPVIEPDYNPYADPTSLLYGKDRPKRRDSYMG